MCHERLSGHGALPYHGTIPAALQKFQRPYGQLRRECGSPEPVYHAEREKEILRRLKDGDIDVVIGTHAVLNKKVECRKLGLLVVDEEQRFGVVQKEKWKSWSSGIDVLTLSATPIPRTLHMSLTGVRTWSLLLHLLPTAMRSRPM